MSHSSTGPAAPSSPAATGRAAPASADGTRLKRVLGVPSLVLFGLVYMVPLTVFTTYGIVTQVTGGRVPVAYMITLATMVFTAMSYARMARAYPFAGSAYTYTQRSFGPGIGFVSGWSLLLDYLFLPTINYLVIGIYLGEAFPAVPSWVFILAAIALVTVLNIVGITSVSRASTVIIAAQVVFIGVFIALSVVSLSGTGDVDLLRPLTGDGTETGLGPVMAGAAILCLSFLGFDAVSTMAEEAKEPTRDVPRAIIIATVSAGLLFILLSYVSHVVHPSHQFADPDSGALDVMASAGGTFLSAFFISAYVAGCIGSALTSQASVSRIIFSMGRDGVFPRSVFGRLSARFATPVIAILVVSAWSLMAMLIDLGVLAEIISFGALVAFSAVNLSVVKHYFIDQKERSGAAVLTNLVLPLIGFGLTVWLWTSLNGRTLIVGLIWMAVGVAYLAIITRGFRRPTPTIDVYESGDLVQRPEEDAHRA